MASTVRGPCMHGGALCPHRHRTARRARGACWFGRMPDACTSARMHACQGEEAWSNGPCHVAHMDARPCRRIVEATTSARARRRLRALQEKGHGARSPPPLRVHVPWLRERARGDLREDCAARKRTHVWREARSVAGRRTS